MADASWDNGGAAPAKKKLGTGMMILMGCGGLLLLSMVTCVVGGLVVGRMVKNNPEAFEKRMEAWGQGLVKKDWDRLRVVVEQLQTEDGAKAVYKANGELQQAYATETEFCAAVRGWRPRLLPLPAEVPLSSHHRHRGAGEAEAPAPEAGTNFDVSLNKRFKTTTIRCRYPNGARVAATFEDERLTSFRMD